MPTANLQYKDRLFKLIFGNPENKQWTLSLYNAINGSAYTDPDEIQLTTIDDVLYLSMRNDVSFLIGDVMNLYEQQSTYNPNMPMRFLIYAGMLYGKYTTTTETYNRYSSTLQKVPAPRCICFYNGTDERAEKEILHLSDAFDSDGDIEINVTMLNINYGKNRALMDACKPLDEYSWFVKKVRDLKEEFDDLGKAVDQAIDDMPDDFLIKGFVMAHKAEVRNVFLTEYDEAKAIADWKQDGVDETNQRVAADMLKENLPLALIERISKLSEAAIRKIAKEINATIVV